MTSRSAAWGKRLHFLRAWQTVLVARSTSMVKTLYCPYWFSTCIDQIDV